MASTNFDPARDIGDLSAKTIVVTGGTAGLGQETIKQLASHGTPRIFFTGRSSKSAEATIQTAKQINSKLEVTFVEADFSNLNSTAAAADRIVRETSRNGIDLIFCNAGIMAAPAGLSQDGYEIQFAVNHIAHALLVKKLLPGLQNPSVKDPRVVFNTSLGFQFASDIAFDALKTKQESMILGAFKRYGQSKLANILYPAELARRYTNIIFVSIHPGVIKTNIITGLSTFNRYFTEATTYLSQIPIEDGAKNQLWAASVDKSKIQNGAFYEPVGKPGVQTAASKNDELAGKLYEWTEQALASK